MKSAKTILIGLGLIASTTAYAEEPSAPPAYRSYPFTSLSDDSIPDNNTTPTELFTFLSENVKTNSDINFFEAGVLRNMSTKTKSDTGPIYTYIFKFGTSISSAQYSQYTYERNILTALSINYSGKCLTIKNARSILKKYGWAKKKKSAYASFTFTAEMPNEKHEVYYRKGVEFIISNTDYAFPIWVEPFNPPEFNQKIIDQYEKAISHYRLLDSNSEEYNALCVDHAFAIYIQQH